MRRIVRVVYWGALPPMPRPRVSRRGGVGLPSRYRARLASLRALIRDAWRDWDPQAVCVEVVTRKPVAPTSRAYGDADNLAKTVLDALPIDDARVVELRVVKLWSPVPSADIVITEVPYDAG